MREILFRGKVVGSKEWVDGNLHIITYGGKKNRYEIWKLGYYDVDYCSVVKPETVSEFSGLYDKNGKRVFEGDLVTCGGKYVFEIAYCDFQWQFKHSGKFMHRLEKEDDRKLEVIGNKWDNPELLEKCRT